MVFMKKSTLLGVAHWVTFGVGTLIIATTTVSAGEIIVTKKQPPLIVSAIIGAGCIATYYALLGVFDKKVAEPIFKAQLNAEMKEAFDELKEKMKN
jgi:hypothetical protein